jgi:UDP-N-acetylmuramate dehydrogenase
MTPREHVPLAERCTSAWGAPRLRVGILGGGSNVVIPDEGVDALVIRLALRGMATRESGGAVELTAAAGEAWDDVVRSTAERGWVGLECLSGIPGLVGATPIQNVGAYGQEVSETVTAVRALDRASATIVALANRDRAFAYRDSMLESGVPDRYVVLGVTYRLALGRAASVRYAGIEKHLDARGIGAPTLGDVRESVLSVRRAKSMVLEPGDPNRRSCGSFVLTPIRRGSRPRQGGVGLKARQ